MEFISLRKVRLWMCLCRLQPQNNFFYIRENTLHASKSDRVNQNHLFLSISNVNDEPRERAGLTGAAVVASINSGIWRHGFKKSRNCSDRLQNK